MIDVGVAAEQRTDIARGTASRVVPPIVVGRHLTPLKAGILMMLALTQTDDPQKIQQIFDSY